MMSFKDLAAAVKDGLTDHEIGELEGMTAGAIASRRHRFGILRPGSGSVRKRVKSGNNLDEAAAVTRRKLVAADEAWAVLLGGRRFDTAHRQRPDAERPQC